MNMFSKFTKEMLNIFLQNLGINNDWVRLDWNGKNRFDQLEILGLLS